MTQTSYLPPVYVYTVDTCCFMGLDGVHRVLHGQAPQILYTPAERGLIWDALEQLARQGRLRIVRQVLEELERWHPEGLKRLQSFARYRAPPTNNELRQRYQRIIDDFPDLLDEDSLYDQADAWIIAVAQQYGYVAVTDELDRTQRTTKKNKDHIPDVCATPNINIRCRTLREVAQDDEGWLAVSGLTATGNSPNNP